MNSIITKFFENMAEAGIKPCENFYPITDGKIHRFRTSEDKHGEKSGAYYIHCESNKCINIGYMDFRKQREMIKVSLPPCSENRVLKLNNNVQSERKKPKILCAWQEYSTGKTEGVKNHSYIRLKKLQNFGGARIATMRGTVCYENDLMIPLINSFSWQFQSIQRISYAPLPSTGKHLKMIYSGTHLKGAMTIFPTKQQPEKIVICEGYATASSLWSLCHGRYYVIASMSCNNLLTVAENIRKQTTLKIIIGADNDEAGIMAGEECIKAGVADEMKTPPEENDWNDYYILKYKK